MKKFPEQILIRTTKKMADELRYQAESHQRSLTQWIRMLLEQTLNQRKAAKKSND
jgi:predicted HicB family RNase H-like nuclease